MTRFVLLASSSSALAAAPLGRCSGWVVDVRLIEQMPVHALRLASVDSERTLTPQDVLALRHDFQVGRIAARRIAAQMIEREASEVSFCEQFVDEAVAVAGSCANPNLTMARLVATPHPRPAFVGASHVGIGRETDGDRHRVQRASPRRCNERTEHVPQFQHPRVYTETMDGVPT